MFNISKLPKQPLTDLSKKALKTLVHENVSNTQLEYLKENCIAVDENDQVIGDTSKAECHKKETAILHRAFSVFIFNPNRELLLQQRASTKITFPNRWTNACCSHPLFTQEEMEPNNELGIRRAARRKLEHELGISQNYCRLEDYVFVGKFLYEADSDHEWKEHELDYVLILKNFTGNMAVNFDEVSATKYVDQRYLDSAISSTPEQFSPWFRLLQEKGWISKWWNDLDNLSKYSTNNIIRLN
uniref:Isopentenyl-diphosphate Delta-isomerase n=1 Tax=Panagrolaimus sp. PS1159 TaxID=55785 RepID=A0AC35F7A8_9BILA